MIPYFTELNTLDVTNCREYALLEGLQAILPKCSVNYVVDLGGNEVDHLEDHLTLNADSYEYDVLLKNLKHLPELQTVTFQQTKLDAEKFNALCNAYSKVTFGYTVELLGNELTAESTSVDLSNMTSADLDDVISKLPLLASLETVKLVGF